jgi:lysozyme family protein
VNDFDACISFVITQEGGYVNDPADPGGETKFGISKRAYPAVDIAALTVDEAKAIYRRDYWDALDLDSRPYGEALAILDTAVNCGLARAKVYIATAKPGPEFAIHLLTERLYAYASFSAWPTYGHGWTARILRCAVATNG